jgi:hypothetical protein
VHDDKLERHILKTRARARISFKRQKCTPSSCALISLESDNKDEFLLTDESTQKHHRSAKVLCMRVVYIYPLLAPVRCISRFYREDELCALNCISIAQRKTHTNASYALAAYVNERRKSSIQQERERKTLHLLAAMPALLIIQRAVCGAELNAEHESALCSLHHLYRDAF